MRTWLASLTRTGFMLLFQALCLLSAFGAFSYLYVKLGGTPGSLSAKFAASGWDVPAHFFAAGLALALVPLQLNNWVRRRAPRLHRIGGWLSAAVILIGGVSGLSLAADAHGGAVTGTSFAIIAVLWLVTMGNGIRHALAGDLVRHRRWMMRCIAVTCAAITLRLTQAVLMGGVHWDFDAAYPVSAWFCWPFNLLVCELFLRWGRGLSPAQPGGRRSASGQAVA